jgi:hypothetical protein
MSKIVIDMSVYQNVYTFEKLKLLRDMGVTHVIIRAGVAHSEDDMLPTIVLWCRLLGLTFSLYFYFYPGLNLRAQVELFEALIAEYPDCKSVWVDVEEYRNFTTNIPYGGDVLNAFYKTIHTYLRNAFPGKLIGNYSGNWVLDRYIPKFYLWARDYPYWNAYYVKYFSWWRYYLSALGANWDNDLRLISITKLPEIMNQIQMHPVPLPNGMTKANLWQCITFIPFKELTYWQRRLDWNICSDADFEYLFGSSATTPPPVPTPVPTGRQYRVTAVTLNIRVSPPVNGVLGARIWTRWLVYGQVVTITAVSDGWGMLSDGGWVSLSWLEET